MLTVFYKTDTKIVMENSPEEILIENLIWVDLKNPSSEEKHFVERSLEVNLQTRQQAEEIESSSRYWETESLIMANSNFLIRHPVLTNEPVSFILKENILISIRNSEVITVAELIKKFETNPRAFSNGFHVFVTLFEIRIDLDADLLESIANEISAVSKQLTVNSTLDERIILNITEFQELCMTMRQNVIDKQRVISGILKSERFPGDTFPKLRVMIKDIGSLLEHASFSFERLEYLQNTFLGLINIEQNKIIKIFTVASVVFMPPTLIASIYGMNFKDLPELSLSWGYPLSILLMILSSTATLIYFKRRKWL